MNEIDAAASILRTRIDREHERIAAALGEELADLYTRASYDAITLLHEKAKATRGEDEQQGFRHYMS